MGIFEQILACLHGIKTAGFGVAYTGGSIDGDGTKAPGEYLGEACALRNWRRDAFNDSSREDFHRTASPSRIFQCPSIATVQAGR